MALEIQRDVPLAPLTTLGLGGPARYFAVARSEDDIREGQALARKNGLRLFILGGGSNTIFLDAGYDGLVLQIALKGVVGLPDSTSIRASDEPGRSLSGSAADRADSAHCAVRVSAGEMWDSFVARSVEAGLSGIESLSGIPGQAGTVPVQNVGAYGQEVSSTIEKVEGLDERGNLITLRADECRFDYRSSLFKSGNPLIITAVHFLLNRAGGLEPSYPELKTAFDQCREQAVPSSGPSFTRVEELRLLRECVLQIRRRKSMVYDVSDPESHSVGSFFLNPILSLDAYRSFQERLQILEPGLVAPAYPARDAVKISAAWLVERAGFARGYDAGGVGVSKAHTLSLVNRGGKASDLLALADRIQDAVREKFGVELHREPIVAG